MHKVYQDMSACLRSPVVKRFQNKLCVISKESEVAFNIITNDIDEAQKTEQVQVHFLEVPHFQLQSRLKPVHSVFI